MYSWSTVLYDQLEAWWKGLDSPFILCICRVFSIESLQLFSFRDWIKNAYTKFITFYSILQTFFIKVQLNSSSPLAVKLSHIKIHYSSSVVFNLYALQPPNVFQERQVPLQRELIYWQKTCCLFSFKLPFTEFFLVTLGAMQGPPGFPEHRLRTTALAGAVFFEYFSHIYSGRGMKQPSKGKDLATTGGLNAGCSVPRRLLAANACAAPLFLTHLLFCMVHGHVSVTWQAPGPAAVFSVGLGGSSGWRPVCGKASRGWKINLASPDTTGWHSPQLDEVLKAVRSVKKCISTGPFIPL